MQKCQLQPRKAMAKHSTNDGSRAVVHAQPRARPPARDDGRQAPGDGGRSLAGPRGRHVDTAEPPADLLGAAAACRQVRRGPEDDRPEEERQDRHLGAERGPVARGLLGRLAGRPHNRRHQSGLPAGRGRLLRQEDRREGCHSAGVLQEPDVRRDAADR